MDVELLRQLGQRLLALDGGQSHLCFESRAVIPARSSRHRLSCSRAILAALRQKLHSSACPNLLSQLYRPNGTAFACRGMSVRQYSLTFVNVQALLTCRPVSAGASALAGS